MNNISHRAFPLVDILIVTYNQKSLVGETLNSVLAQDYPNIRIIISDDASQDGSQDILKEYHKNYPDKISLNINKKNLGITENVNLLCAMSDAPYVIIFSGDDRMRPDRVSKQVDILERNPKAAGCMSDVKVLHVETGISRIYRNNDFVSCKPKKIIATHNQVPSASLMVNRKVFGTIVQDYRLPVVGDWLFVNQVAIKGLVYIQEPLTIYCRHALNATRPGVERIYLDDRLAAIDLLFAEHKTYYFACKTARSNVYISAGYRYLDSGYFSQACYFFMIAWVESPLNSRAYKVIPNIFMRCFLKCYRKIKKIYKFYGENR